VSGNNLAAELRKQLTSFKALEARDLLGKKLYRVGTS
jgi:hypothetical protein